MEDPVAEATADVAQASAAAKADPELQRVLSLPKVQAAMERIASNPQAINDYKDDPLVLSALERLNGLLIG